MLDRPSLFVLGSFVFACSARVGRFPARGESAVAEHVVIEPGGKGFNLAAGARRLGARVHTLFSIGDDLLAQTAIAAFDRAGITPIRLRQNPGQTGCGIGFIDATGETCIAIHPGANLALAEDDVQAVADEIASAGAVLAPFEIADAPIAEAFALARRHGVETILNPSPFRLLPEAIFRNTSILVVNNTEVSALAQAIGQPPCPTDPIPRAIIDAFLGHGPHTILVTRGPNGAIAYRRDARPLHQSAFDIAPIDSLGAGDAFLAAFATGLVEARPIEACLREAAAAGALATLRPGVFDALPTRDDLEQFLADRHSEAPLQALEA